MAVTWESDTIQRTGTNYVDFPENIDLDPDLNGRHEPHTEEELNALAADILENGQHTPVLLRKGDNGRPVLVYGFRRWEAVSLLNKRGHKTKLIGNYECLNDQEAFVAAIGENRFRKDVSAIDDAANIKVFVNRFKMSIEDIAKVYFPEAKTEAEVNHAVHFVKQRQALIELAPEAAKAVRDGRVKSITAAVRLAKLSKDAQRQRVANSNGRIKGTDVHHQKSKPMTVKQLVQNLLKDLKPGELENPDNELVSLDRKKFRKLATLVGAV